MADFKHPGTGPRNMVQKIFFNQISSFDIAIAPLAFFIFTLQYTGRAR